MFKFVAVSMLALGLAACGSNADDAGAVAAPEGQALETPAVEANPTVTAEPTSVPAEGVSAAAVPVEVTSAVQ